MKKKFFTKDLFCRQNLYNQSFKLNLGLKSCSTGFLFSIPTILSICIHYFCVIFRIFFSSSFFFSSLLLLVAVAAFSLLALTWKRKNEHSMCNYFSNSFERFPFITAIVCCFSKEKIEIVFATCVWTCKNSQQ